ncbi:hypothetical protein H4R20_001335 [Coemansia guatemalensis]|uniref:AAA-ATPase-like domain-containing protein n=1 Tax=Coemansia guatemalensis TaxID=2761395 RepID=A0A9W8HX78_9FUNG|nr:hypothetical protein H4R20_001335 [Coemansia guatemalensis]
MTESGEPSSRKRRNRRISSSSSEAIASKATRLTDDQSSFTEPAVEHRISREYWAEAFESTSVSQIHSELAEDIGEQLRCETNPLERDSNRDSLLEYQRTPEHTASSSYGPTVSPRTRIKGRTIALGTSNWDVFIRRDSTLVDKSMAIADIVGYPASVIAGVYPRRMGKTTFLDTLANFLDVIGSLPRSRREEEFRQCAIYESHPQIFNRHFAKYAVFRLDLKTQAPATLDEAENCLLDIAVSAAEPYVELLRGLVNGDAHTDIAIELDESTIRKCKPSFQNYLKMYDTIASMMYMQSFSGAVNTILPRLMGLLFNHLGIESVLLVDEYDAPYLGALRGTHIEEGMHTSIMDAYSKFLSAMLKNNKYLYKGILVGVFDVRNAGLGSGLNNVETHLAHSGLADSSYSFNPFQRAFGFSAQDVWGLVNEFLDSQWRYREGRDDLPQFKKELFTGCLKQFDGYRIGQSRYVFNPYAVLRFLEMLQRIDSPDKVIYSGHNFWIETGSMRAVNSIRAESIEDLQRFYTHLKTSFLQQLEYRKSAGAEASLESADYIDDMLVESICSQDQPRISLEYDQETGKELTAICFSNSSSYSNGLAILEVGALDAQTIMWILYQAGYLAPISSNRVGIPNQEVLRALGDYYKRVVKFTSVSADPRGPAYQIRGICSGDLVQLAISLNELFAQMSGLNANTPEKEYHNALFVFLYPAKEVGFDVYSEASMENGFADILVFPGADHRLFPQSQQNYFVFELKCFRDSGNMSYKQHMSMGNREETHRRIRESTIEALQQIQERYQQAAAARASLCDWMFLVGVTFWFHRFEIAVLRFKKAYSAHGNPSWENKPYTNNELDGAATDRVSVEINDGVLFLSTISC